MDLFQLRPKKRLDWPHELTQIPKDIEPRLNARGRDFYRMRHPSVRSDQAGFVVDMDSPGEAFFCRDGARFLDRVPEEEIPAAKERLKAQGPIKHQPALDWLEAKGMRREAARPEEEPVADTAPLGKAKADVLKGICDALELPHGKVDEMRNAIVEAAECSLEDVVFVDEAGEVQVTVAEPAE